MPEPLTSTPDRKGPKVIRVRMDASTVGRTRLAVSPIAETLGWLSALSAGGARPTFGLTHADFVRVSDPDVSLVALLVSRDAEAGYLPDFLTPKPFTGKAPAIFRDQLDHLAATDHAEACQQIATSFSGRPVPTGVQRLIDDGNLPLHAARGLHRFWSGVGGGQFAHLQTRLADDIAHRSEQLGRYGLSAVMDSLHHRVTWHGDGFDITTPSWHETLALTDAELVLVPTVLFARSNLTAQFGDPAQAVLTYPVARSQRESRVGLKGGVSSLLGHTRAKILRSIGHGRTTAQLSQGLGLSPAVVSYHLGVLHRAGLVRRLPRGRYVIYELAPAGHIILHNRPNDSMDEDRD